MIFKHGKFLANEWLYFVDGVKNVSVLDPDIQTQFGRLFPQIRKQG
jgi:hypothetical protein